MVSSNATLFDLHKIIQIAMGWTNSHLHLFIIADEYYSIPSEADLEPMIDERKYRLAEMATAEQSKFVYEYDFGDSWEHATGNCIQGELQGAGQQVFLFGQKHAMILTSIANQPIAC